MIRVVDADFSGKLGEILAILAGQTGAIDASGEAPPFYETIAVRHWGSGNRQKTYAGSPYGLTVYESIDYDESKTFTRIPISTDAVYNSSIYSDYGQTDLFSTPTSDPPGDGLFKAALMRIPMYAVPDLRRHYLVAWFEATTGEIVIGSRTINYADPAETDITEDINGSFDFFPWEWVVDPNPPTNRNDPWNLIQFPTSWGIEEYDVSAITNWRDLRGTYEFSKNDSDIDGSWDSNDVVHHTSYVIA